MAIFIPDIPLRSFLASKLGVGDGQFFLALDGVFDDEGLDCTFCKGLVNPLVIMCRVAELLTQLTARFKRITFHTRYFTNIFPVLFVARGDARCFLKREYDGRKHEKRKKKGCYFSSVLWLRPKFFTTN